MPYTPTSSWRNMEIRFVTYNKTNINIRWVCEVQRYNIMQPYLSFSDSLLNVYYIYIVTTYFVANGCN